MQARATRSRLVHVATVLRKKRVPCDACGKPIVGEPAGHGVNLTLRDDVAVHEPLPLCDECAHAIGMAALYRFAEEEEEG
jgi:hypothetical protein